MSPPLRFILNDAEIATHESPGMTMLDFIRKKRRLTGTKIGCREGDCGACTVLIGEWGARGFSYRSMTSCLMPLGNAVGKHVVTIEGLNRDKLTPIQRAIVERGGTQCGFCTVGFVVSLAGFCLNHQGEPSLADCVEAMDGNICRCTGYKSLIRAGEDIVENLPDDAGQDILSWLVEHEYLPEYFKEIPARLAGLDDLEQYEGKGSQIVGGGTDLFVQRPETMVDLPLNLILDEPQLDHIEEENGRVILGATVTAQQIMDSRLLRTYFPDLRKYMKLVSSTPIRNMGTLAGNLVNASPIGDLTIYFLALDAELKLVKDDQSRQLKLRDFYKGYKELDLAEGEMVTELSFPKPSPGDLFNFEKVSKRTNLDIASVNSAMSLSLDGEVIVHAHLSAGGVAPTPLYLHHTSAWLQGKTISAETLREAGALVREEVHPISDARGSADYKRLLLRQLLYAHFFTFFPERFQLEALV